MPAYILKLFITTSRSAGRTRLRSAKADDIVQILGCHRVHHNYRERGFSFAGPFYVEQALSEKSCRSVLMTELFDEGHIAEVVASRDMNS